MEKRGNRYIALFFFLMILFAVFVIAAWIGDIHIDLVSPSNNYYDNDGNINFTCNATIVSGNVNTSLVNLSLLFNLTDGTWEINQTNSTANGDLNNGSLYNFTILGLDDGIYTWACRACLNASENDNCNQSVNRTLTIDSTNPLVGLVSPVNNTWSSTSSVTFTYVPKDTNIDTCVLYGNFDGTWQTNETNTSVDTTVQDIFTINLDDRANSVWNILCNDSAGNSAFNETNLTISVDITDPTVTINSPSSAINTTNRTQAVSVTFYDGTRGLNNESINVTINATSGTAVYNVSNMSCDNTITMNYTTSTTCNFTSQTLPEGVIELNASALDGLGNFRNSSITFNVDLTAPTTAPNLTLVNDTDLDGNMDLNWTPDNNAASYRIYRSDINRSNASGATLLATGVTGNSFEDNLSRHANSYFYGVVSVDWTGNYNTSIINSTTGYLLNGSKANDTINPAVISGQVRVRNSTKYAYLRWYNVTRDTKDNSDDFGMRYKIYVATSNVNLTKTYINESGTGFSYWTTVSTNTTTYTASSSGTYHFIVTPLDDAGNWNNTIVKAQNYINTSLTVSSDDGDGSTGGGGGGGSGTSTEGISSAKLWTLFPVGTNTMTISKTEISFTELSINSLNSKSDVEITVIKLDSKPTSITASVTDEPYQYIEIAKEGLVDADVNRVDITFKVEKTWLNTEGINEANVKLYRYSSSKWNALTTTKESSDSDYVYYKATSPGLSYFVIGGTKPSSGTAGELSSSEGTSSESTDTSRSTEEGTLAEKGAEIAKKLKKPWIVWSIVAFFVILLLVGFFIYIKKEEEKLV